MIRKVYLAGPMRGLEQQNFPKFFTLAHRLRENGYEVVNPAELDRDAGVDPNDPSTKLDIRAAFARDVAALLECDAVFLMAGWTYSLGATAEASLALAAGMKVFTTNASGHPVDEIRRIP